MVEPVRYTDDELKPLVDLVAKLVPFKYYETPARLQPLRELAEGLANIPASLLPEIERPEQLTTNLSRELAEPLLKMVKRFGPKVVASRISININLAAGIAEKMENQRRCNDRFRGDGGYDYGR